MDSVESAAKDEGKRRAEKDNVPNIDRQIDGFDNLKPNLNCNSSRIKGHHYDESGFAFIIWATQKIYNKVHNNMTLLSRVCDINHPSKRTCSTNQPNETAVP